MDDFVMGILDRLRTAFEPTRLGDTLAEFVANLTVAVLTFAAFYLLWRLLERGLRPALRRAKVDATSTTFLHTLLKYTILAIGAVQALSAFGVNTGTLLTSLGLAGLTVGFAARDALSNLISGLLIFWDRPFVIGDLVEVESSYGRVDRITLRSTRIVTVDGKMLAVPNTTIINSTVASYTNFPHLRLDIDVTVAVTEDIDRARAVILNVVDDDARYLPQPAPRVVVRTLGDYNVGLQLQVWIKDEREHVAHRYALRERVFKALGAAGVEMPFETISVVSAAA